MRMSIEDARARAKVLKALGHPLRLQIVDVLSGGDRCVRDLQELGRVRQPTLSRHINVLRQAGLLTERRAGPRLILQLATPCIVRAFDCAMQVVQADHARRSRAVKRTAA